MKFTIKKDVLLTGLNKVYGVAEKNTTIAILSNVLLEVANNKLSITSSDMVLEVSSVLPCDNGIDGNITINAYTFHDIIKKLNNDNDIHIELIDNKLVIKSGKSLFKIGALPSVDYPIMDGGFYNTEFTLTKDNLNHLINKVKYAVSNDEMRYYLNGICWHGENGFLNAVATDGHRLAVSKVEIKLDELEKIIIPFKTCNIISKIMDGEIGDINVMCSPEKIKFVIGDTVIISKLIDGTYPDYEKIIPTDNDLIVNLNAGELLSCIDRVSSVLDNKTNSIAFEFKDDTLKVSSKHDGNSANDEIVCDSNNIDLRIGFNAKYLRDALLSVDNNSTVNLKDVSSSIIVKSENKDDYIAVIMPLMI